MTTYVVETWRKQPVEIKCVRIPTYRDFTDHMDFLKAIGDVAEWCGGSTSRELDMDDDGWHSGDHIIYIPTLEGTMTAHLGDYIICGVDGEFYSCKESIFYKTYEQVIR